MAADRSVTVVIARHLRRFGYSWDEGKKISKVGRELSFEQQRWQYMRRTAGYTWTYYKTNTQIAKELKITPILDKLLEYKRNWIQHVNRMHRNRLPRVRKHYSPVGRRNHGRPLKRLLDA
jgi:hypothetical protein